MLPTAIADVGEIDTAATVFDVIPLMTALYVFVPETAILTESPILNSVPKRVLAPVTTPSV